MLTKRNVTIGDTLSGKRCKLDSFLLIRLKISITTNIEAKSDIKIPACCAITILPESAMIIAVPPEIPKYTNGIEIPVGSAEKLF